MPEVAAVANFFRRREFYPVVRLFGIGALVCFALSLGVVASSNPFLAVAQQVSYSPPVMPDAAPRQTTPPAPDDQGLQLIFRASLMVAVPSLATPLAVHPVTVPSPMKEPVTRKNVSSAPASGSVSYRLSKGRPRIGSLICKSVQTSPEFDCILTLSRNSTPFRYVAAVRQVGSEFGVSQVVSLSWGVFSTNSTLPKQQELAGTYNDGGRSPTDGPASPGALVGGRQNAITLLPRAGDGGAKAIVSMQLAAR